MERGVEDWVIPVFGKTVAGGGGYIAYQKQQLDSLVTTLKDVLYYSYIFCLL
jgi:hypothetical protein